MKKFESIKNNNQNVAENLSEDFEFNAEKSREELSKIGKGALKVAEKFEIGGFSHIPEKTKVDPEDYKWFPITDTNDKTRTMTAEEFPEAYLKATAQSIAVMDGTGISAARQNSGVKPDVVIGFDKSVRPAMGAVRLMWKDFAQKGAKIPDMSTLNIDRADLFNFFENIVSKDGRFMQDMNFGGIDTVSRGDLVRPYHFQKYIAEKSKKDENFLQAWRELKAGVRAQYISDDIELSPDEDYITKIENSPTKLDGKNVLLFDEVVRSGSTFDIGEFLIGEAIPEIKSFSHHSYWGSPVAKGGHVYENGALKEAAMGGVPVWYMDKKGSDGRGISDADDFYFAAKYMKDPTSKNFKRKIGAKVLSTPRYTHTFDEKMYKYIGDKKYREIMGDFKQLRKDYRDGKVAFPGVGWWNDDRYGEFLASKNEKPPENDG